MAHPDKRPRSIWRLLFNLACALSLLLGLSVAILAVRSIWKEDMAEIAYRWYPTPDSFHERWLSLRSLRGTLEFGIVRNDFDLRHPEGIVSTGGEPGWIADFLRENPRGVKGEYTSVVAMDDGRETSIIFPSRRHDDQPKRARHDEYWSLDIPAPYIVLIVALLPALYVLRAMRQRTRRLGGLCLTCGYDLRASDEVCPECGARTPCIAVEGRTQAPPKS